MYGTLFSFFFLLFYSSSSFFLVVTSSSSYMALQPISGLGLLFMRFRNLTLIDGW
jgi:hypothetical protein